jgi:microsomal dipeptidase-like Zn-dependent dipeptidase
VKIKTRLWLYVCFTLFLLFSHHFAQAAGIELHAHLFMKEGMTWFFRGSFDGPLRATTWQDGLSSQANPATMDQSGLDVVVVSLYANPFFTLSLRDSVRKQIAVAHRFVTEHPNWIIAKHPDQAKAALAAGKKVLILSLEGTSGILENEEDYQEFIDRDGVRIVTLLHLTDDHLGGVAFLLSFRAWASPLAALNSLIHPHRDTDGNKLNPQGLTEEGRKVARELIKRKVWIDLAHSSDASQKDLVPLLLEGHQPHLFTHTALRKYHHAERGINAEQLALVRETGGFVGIMPSEMMLKSTPPTGPCSGSVHALATQFREFSSVLGQKSISMGSDFNGGISHLKSSCNTGTDLDRNGFWNIGQTPALWQALKSLKVWEPQPAGQDSTARFLETWAKLWS